MSSKKQCRIPNFEELWIDHPNPLIDLFISPVGYYVDQLNINEFLPHYSTMEKSLIPSEEQFKDFTPLEDIMMIGYPNGLWDSENNLPIVRRGITATSISTDYNGKKGFLIDSAVYPGSSGSPIFMFNEGSYSTPRRFSNWHKNISHRNIICGSYTYCGWGNNY
ncbi:serine protease family protein [Candidatus Nitrosocosmicus sp. T]